MVPEKSLGTGIGISWYRKKVSEKFGTEKRYRYRYRKYLVPEKSIGIGIVQHFGYRHTLGRNKGLFYCNSPLSRDPFLSVSVFLIENDNDEEIILAVQNLACKAIQRNFLKGDNDEIASPV